VDGGQTLGSALPGRAYPPPPKPEPLWPSLLTVVASIALQVLLPDRLTAGPAWLLPVLEGGLLAALWALSPRHLAGIHRMRRRLALLVTAIVSAANAISLALLTHELLHHEVVSGQRLIVSGVLIWLTNVLIFSLWYWETDRGGPGRRAAGEDGQPDFLFPQMNDDRIQPAGWRPEFIDYLYLSLTNAMALSPTDTMPLTGAAKSMMGLQSLISLVTLALIVSRAVNIL